MILPLAMITSSVGTYHHPKPPSYLVSHLYDSHILHLQPGNRHGVYQFLVQYL